MQARKILALGGLAAAGGGVALLVGRLTGSRWGGRVVGDGYRSGGVVRGMSGGCGSRSTEKTDRWLAVTVNRPPQEIQTKDGLPGPLAELGDGVRLRIQPAPADKGTEIRALPVAPSGSPRAKAAGEDPRQRVRQALRETKQILETGEVLSPDKPSTTRDDTPGGKLLGAATGRARKEGLL